MGVHGAHVGNREVRVEVVQQTPNAKQRAVRVPGGTDHEGHPLAVALGHRQIEVVTGCLVREHVGSAADHPEHREPFPVGLQPDAVTDGRLPRPIPLRHVRVDHDTGRGAAVVALREVATGEELIPDGLEIPRAHHVVDDVDPVVTDADIVVEVDVARTGVVAQREIPDQRRRCHARQLPGPIEQFPVEALAARSVVAQHLHVGGRHGHAVWSEPEVHAAARP